jgi:hypothetical protein
MRPSVRSHYDYDGPQGCAECEHGKTHQAGFRDVRSNDNFGITGIRTPPVDMVFGSADHLAMGLRAADCLPQCRISTTGILSPIRGINPGGEPDLFHSRPSDNVFSLLFDGRGEVVDATCFRAGSLEGLVASL